MFWMKTMYHSLWDNSTEVCCVTNVTAGKSWDDVKLAIYKEGNVAFAPGEFGTITGSIIKQRPMDVEEAFFWAAKRYDDKKFREDFKKTYNVSDEKFWEMWDNNIVNL